jgi:hypothetical protein
MPWVRIVSGAIALVVALGWVIVGGWLFTAGVSLMVFLGQREYFALAHLKGILPATKTTLVVSQILVIVATVAPHLTDPVLALGAVGFVFISSSNRNWQRLPILPLLFWGFFMGAICPVFGCGCGG